MHKIEKWMSVFTNNVSLFLIFEPCSCFYIRSAYPGLRTKRAVSKPHFVETQIMSNIYPQSLFNLLLYTEIWLFGKQDHQVAYALGGFTAPGTALLYFHFVEIINVLYGLCPSKIWDLLTALFMLSLLLLKFDFLLVSRSSFYPAEEG